MYSVTKSATVLRQCSWKRKASLYWSWLTGGHQLSGLITPLSFPVTAFHPCFIHQLSSVLLLLLYRKMKSSPSAIRISPLLRVSVMIFMKFLFLLLSLSHHWSSLSITQPPSIQNPSSPAFLSVGVMAAVGVLCVLLFVDSPSVGTPDLGSTVGKTEACVSTHLISCSYAVLIFSAV